MIEAVFSNVETQALIIVIDGEQYPVMPTDCAFVVDCVNSGLGVTIEC